jgi:hypothetical protein
MIFQVESVENVDADVLAAPVLGEEALAALVASETGCYRIRAEWDTGNSEVLHPFTAPEHAQGTGKAQPVGIDPVVQGGLVHEGADGQMRQEQAVEFLDHFTGMLAAQRARMRPLLDLDL